jgi:hypothetical protein
LDFFLKIYQNMGQKLGSNNHNEVLGHSIENCKNFMYQVRKLVSKGQIEFVKSGGTYHIVTSIFNND